MGKLSSYVHASTLTGTELVPIVVTPGIVGGNAYITADEMAVSARVMTPPVETTTNPIFTVTPPTRAPWEQIQFGSGPQADGSYDHVMVMGWNASVFPDNGVDSTPNVPAIFMGFEDGWYDGARNGAEWWVGYYSPDRSVSLFRPFYTRILNDLKATTVAAGSNGVNTSTFAGAGVLNVASTTGYPTSGKVYVVTAGTPATVTFTGKSATTFTGCTTTAGGGVMSTGGAVTGYTWGAGTILDIGTDGTGAFVVQAGPATIPLTVTETIMTFKTNVGAAAVIVDGATTSTVQFKVATAASFQWLAPSVGQLQLIDKLGRAHILFTQGTSSVAAQSDFTSSMIVQGRLRVGPGAALATNATDGFFYLPTCAGIPTGAPLAQTGSMPMIVDSTNNHLYAYNSGWIPVGQTGVALVVGANILTYHPVSGAATFVIDGSTSSIQFKVAGASSFQWLAPSAGQMQLLDKDGRAHILFTQGASSVAAQSDFTSSMIVQGRLRVGPGAALATNATDGFFYLPTCAGTPTGAPLAQTGSIALIFDTTNNFLYAYNGAWKKTTVFA